MALNNLPLNKKCWVRCIKIKLISKIFNVKPMIFGYNDELTDDEKRKFPDININQLNINVSGEKKIASNQDGGTITISNLTYAQIVRIMQGQYYEIEIWAGYKTTGMQCFFKGEIAYISDKISERRDHTCYIEFASKLVASFTQWRMNLNYNSGINLWSAFRYMFLTKGISSNHLPDSLKNYTIDEITTLQGNMATLPEQLANMNNNLLLSTDTSVTGGVVDCSTIKDKRQIVLNNDTILFEHGNPTVTSAGLHIEVMPTFNFTPGDIILIDNAIVDVSQQGLERVKNEINSNYLDPNGAYMVREIKYNFQNRGNEFKIEMDAIALSIITNITGGK